MKTLKNFSGLSEINEGYIINAKMPAFHHQKNVSSNHQKWLHTCILTVIYSGSRITESEIGYFKPFFSAVFWPFFARKFC